MKVSVAMITYNHQEFIAKALDSILMQRTNFDYEIVVGEDCSKDNTRAILLDYQESYPGRFRLLLDDANIGMNRNLTRTLEACSGAYIALLEGDDYWTAPDKLQKQVDFLDGHPECASCFHDSLIVHKDGSKEPEHYRPSQKEFSGVEDILMDNFIPTASVMFRRGLFGRVPDWVCALEMGDWPIHILNSLHGKIGYLDETMAVYLVHPGGIWSLKDWQFREFALIRLFEALGTHLEPKYARLIHRYLRWKYLFVSEAYEETGDIAGARAYAVKSLLKHLVILSNPRRGRIDRELAPCIPHYVKAADGAKSCKTVLRLYAVPALKKYGIAVLKPRAPRLYELLRAKAISMFGVKFDV